MRWSDEVWVPVNIKGFRHLYEMCPLGFVRRTSQGWGSKGGRWLAPQAGRGHSPNYLLRDGKRQARLYVADILSLFDLTVELDARWMRDTRSRAVLENAGSRRQRLSSDLLYRAVHDAEEAELEALFDTLERGCPWARCRVGGDARGADPTLGF